MDLRKQLHLHPKHMKGDAAQLAAQLAPLEELHRRGAGSSPTGDPKGNFALGAIVVDNDDLSIPKDIMEGSDEKTYLGMEPVVIVILGFMLLFIAFIAWQISLMPVE